MRILHLFFILSILLSSCGVYRQNVVNVPLMQKKGQVQLSGHLGFTGTDAQFAYALTNNIAFIGNYAGNTTKQEFSTTNYKTEKHTFGELGLGYFSKPVNQNYLELFFIAGNGFTSSFTTGGDTSSSSYFADSKRASYNRFLVQANFGKKNNKMEFALTPRLIFVHYFDIEDNTTTIFKTIPSNFLYSDLSFTVRYSISKNFKLSWQMSMTIPVTGYKAAYYEFSPFNSSFGLILNMNLFKSESLN